MSLQGTVGFDPNDPLGCDLAMGSDLDPSHRLESGVTGLVHDLFWRLQTSRGQLLDDADYGLNVIFELLNRPLTPAQLAIFPRRVEGECRKDERVETVSCEIAQTDTYAFTLTLRGTSTLGPFKLVVGVANAQAAILEAA